jgi:hypothetical protein
MTRKTAHGHILTDDAGGLELHVPYSERFVRDLKDAIPAAHRSYDRKTESWSIGADWSRMALSLMHDYYPHATKDRNTMHRFT